MDAALRLFASHGYRGASVERIATLARVAKPAIYYHFGSKDGLYRALVETTATGYVVIDGRGKVLDANARALGFFLLEKGRFAGRLISDLISGVDAALIQTVLRNLEQGTFTHIESYGLRKDGTTFPTEVVVSRMQRPGGDHLCFFVRDITRRRAVEEELAQATEELQNHVQFLEALFAAMSNPVFYKDREGRYLGCNTAFEKLAGKTSAQIAGRTVAEIWPREHAKIYHERDLALLSSPGVQIYEGKARNPQGEDRDVIFNKSTFHQADGSVAGLIGIIIDITDRKRMEEDLRQIEVRKRALLNSMPDTMFRCRADGVILDYKSGGCCEPACEPLGSNISQALPWVAASFMEYALRALSEKTPQVFEYQRGEDARGTLHFEMRIVACGEAEVLAIIRDITERKRSEKAQKEMEQRDLEIARDIQKVLLPSVFPRRAGAEFGAFYIPAQKLGGDYYDLIEVDDTHVGIAVADVSGKGVSGALLMAMCRSSLRTWVTGNLSPSQTLKQLNRIIHPDMKEDKFISMLYGVFDVQTKVFTFCRAGHEPLLLYRPSTGTGQFLAPRGMAIGIEGGKAFDSMLVEEWVALRNGDIMVFYTDGVTEARDRHGREFGRERLMELVRANASRSAEEITWIVEESIRNFIGSCPLADDMTLLVFRLPPSDAASSSKP